MAGRTQTPGHRRRTAAPGVLAAGLVLTVTACGSSGGHTTSPAPLPGIPAAAQGPGIPTTTTVPAGGADALTGDEQAALSAARTAGAILSTYDYRDLTGPGSEADKVTAIATPAFLARYQASLPQLSAELASHRAVATGTVIGAGLASFDGTTAQVLLFIDQQVSTDQTTNTTQSVRSELDMVDSGGRWLVGGVSVPS